MIVTLIDRSAPLKSVEACRYTLYNELKEIAAALISNYSLVRIEEEDSNNEVHIICDFQKNNRREENENDNRNY